MAGPISEPTRRRDFGLVEGRRPQLALACRNVGMVYQLSDSGLLHLALGVETITLDPFHGGHGTPGSSSHRKPIPMGSEVLGLSSPRYVGNSLSASAWVLGWLAPWPIACSIMEKS